MAKFLAFTALLILAFCHILLAQDPDIPVAERNRTSPITFSTDIVRQGNSIYQNNCKSCHGDPGKGNYAVMDPIPVDPVSRQYQENSDGEMFYILREGRGLMPSFSGALTEMERWAVIAYVRSFNREYVQPPLAEIIDIELTSTLALLITAKPDEGRVYAQLIDTVSGGSKPVANAQIRLAVRRTFGNLQLAESTSDEEGIAEFNFPSTLPGDTAGNVTLIAIAGSEGKEVRATTVEPMGAVTIPKKLLDQRAWWNVNAMAPLWLIATFSLSLLAGLLTIAYVLFLLYKIKMHSSPKTEEHEN